MSVYTEKEFEDEICAYLSGNHWLYNKGDAQNYDLQKQRKAWNGFAIEPIGQSVNKGSPMKFHRAFSS